MDCVVAQMFLEALKECLFQVSQSLRSATEQIFDHRPTKLLRVFTRHIKVGYLATDRRHDVRLPGRGLIVEPSEVFRLNYHFESLSGGENAKMRDLPFCRVFGAMQLCDRGSR